MKTYNPHQHDSVAVTIITEQGISVAVEWEVQLFNDDGEPTIDLRDYATTMLANLINEVGYRPDYVTIDYMSA